MDLIARVCHAAGGSCYDTLERARKKRPQPAGGLGFYRFGIITSIVGPNGRSALVKNIIKPHVEPARPLGYSAGAEVAALDFRVLDSLAWRMLSRWRS